MANPSHSDEIGHHSGNALRVAIVQHHGRDGSHHAVRLESRCACAHNAAHALAKYAQDLGYRSTVQTWYGGAPLAVLTTSYPRDDWDDLPW